MNDINVVVLLSLNAFAFGVGGVYADARYDHMLAAGTARLVSTLGETAMNETCAVQAQGGRVRECRTFGEYHVRQTHGDTWVISRKPEEGKGGSGQELVLVSGGKLYVSETVDHRKLLSTKFEAISGVVGKSINEIVTGKN